VTARYEQAVWSWSQHLRRAGTTPWAEWVASGAGGNAVVPADWAAPGAAQLELFRRLAERHASAPGAWTEFSPLADLVLSRSGPGRGLAQQPLTWPHPPAVRRFGAPPTDPADVPVEELVRAGVGALTELCLAAGGVPSGRTSRRRLPLTRTPAFQLAGAPVTTSAVRGALAVAGHAEGGRSPRVVLLAEPLDRALAQVWSARVQQGAAVRWTGFVQRWSARRELPPSVDLPTLARTWADRVGPQQVHVVVAPTSSTAATATVAGILGLGPGRRRQGLGRGLQPRWHELTPAAVDVVRRVNTVLDVRVGEGRHAEVLRSLVPAVASGPTGGPGLTVPEPSQDWVRRRAEEMAEELTAGGYPVHGSPAGLVPAFQGVPTHPRRRDVLEVVVTACLALAGRADASGAGSGEETRSSDGG
jgi:hypothetical protein